MKLKKKREKEKYRWRIRGEKRKPKSSNKGIVFVYFRFDGDITTGVLRTRICFSGRVPYLSLSTLTYKCSKKVINFFVICIATTSTYIYINLFRWYFFFKPGFPYFFTLYCREDTIVSEFLTRTNTLKSILLSPDCFRWKIQISKNGKYFL